MVAGVIFDAGMRVITRRWGSRSADELLRLALSRKLDNAPAATTDEIIRGLKDKRESVEIIPITESPDRTTKTSITYLPRHYPVSWLATGDPQDDPDGLLMDLVGATAPEQGAHLLQREAEATDQEAQEAALSRLTPTQAARLRQMVEVIRAWPSPRKPTDAQVAEAMRLSVARVKQLKKIARGLADPRGRRR